MNRIAGYAYRAIYRFREAAERYHPLIVAFEVVLLALGLYRVLFHRADEMPWLEDFDFGLFLTLLAFLAAHTAVTIRRRRLGYDFARWLERFARRRAPAYDERKLVVGLQSLRRRGVYGAPAGQNPDAAVDRTARAIASASASIYSVRTFGTTDAEWAEAETEYLSAWLARFPAAIWRVPPLDNLRATRERSADPRGYFSVIVPVAKESYEMIRRGHLNTALAHLDADAVAFASAPRIENYAKPLYLLAYAQVAVDPAARIADPMRLLYCSLEHFAYLLRRFYPLDDAWRSRSRFSIICEAANQAQRHALTMLGLEAVTREGTSAPVQSPVGFTLCEAEIGAGERRTGGDLLLRVVERGLAPIATVHADYADGVLVDGTNRESWSRH